MQSDAQVLYVCDDTRADQLLASMASWRRYRADIPVTILNIGLSVSTEKRLREEPLVDVTPLIDLRPLGNSVFDNSQRFRAYRTKSRMGHFTAGDPIVFLDTDIVVVSDDFFGELLAVPEGVVSASPSAWDTNFNWTYTSTAHEPLRRSSRLPSFDPEWSIPNSGVVAARSRTLSAICDRWASSFDDFLSVATPSVHCNHGATPGDQEFLGLAMRSVRTRWNRLHGAYNMQVHHDRMPWTVAESPLVLRRPEGGHHGEAPRQILAIHYGLDSKGMGQITQEMLPSPEARAWIDEAYRSVGRIAYKNGTIISENS